MEPVSAVADIMEKQVVDAFNKPMHHCQGCKHPDIWFQKPSPVKPGCVFIEDLWKWCIIYFIRSMNYKSLKSQMSFCHVLQNTVSSLLWTSAALDPSVLLYNQVTFWNHLFFSVLLWLHDAFRGFTFHVIGVEWLEYNLTLIWCGWLISVSRTVAVYRCDWSCFADLCRSLVWCLERTKESPAANFYYQQLIAYRPWLAPIADTVINVAIYLLYVKSRHAGITLTHSKICLGLDSLSFNS